MINSLTNKYVKLACSLHHKKGRLEQNLYLAEGIHLVREALEAGVEIKQFFWSEKLFYFEEGKALWKNLQDRFEGLEVSENVFGKMCETETPQGVLTLIRLPGNPVLELQDVKLGLIFDSLQDPGNVGSIIRTAWAAGLDCLFFTPKTADPYQGKVVRASMGGIFHQKIFREVNPESILKETKKNQIQIVAGDQKVSHLYFDCNLQPPTLFLIGNEGSGLSEIWSQFSIKRVLIPQPGKAESLNASVSAGILIYEALRQRLIKGTCKSSTALI